MADDIDEVTMPKLGETVTEGTLGRWLKEVGEPVAFDDPLFEVSTDKVDSEIPSPYDGVLLEVLVRPATPSRWARRWPGSGRTRPGPASARRWTSRSARPVTSRRPPQRAPTDAGPRRRRRGARGDAAQAGRDGHRGYGGPVAQGGRRPGRVRRPAVRGLHRQGRLRDPQPVRRGSAGDPGAGGRDRAGGHHAGPHRRSERGTVRRTRPGGTGTGAGRIRRARGCAGRARHRRRPHRRRPPGTARAACSPPWCARLAAEHQPRPGAGSPAPAAVAGSCARTCSRRSRRAPAPAQAAPAAPAAPRTGGTRGGRDAPGRRPPGAGRRARRGRAAVPDPRWSPPSGWSSRGAPPPHVWTSIEVDLERIEQVRQKHKARVPQGRGRVADLPAVHRPGGVRRAARLPAAELLDRHGRQDDHAAPLRQPRHRGRRGRAWA